MALQKEKVLASGVSGNYWRVSMLSFKRENMALEMQVSLYKDSTPNLAPLGVHHQFKFTITQQEIVGNLVTWAYDKIKAYADSDIPNLNGVGTHKGCEDLAGATDV
jgi:hypothetical protein